MRKLLALALLLTFAAGGAQARPVPGALQSGSAPGTRWGGLRQLMEPDDDASDYTSTSVAVDSEGISHFLHTTRYRITYYNTRLDLRQANGFSSPVEIDFAPPAAGGLWWETRFPDIWVDKQDRVHAIWTYAQNGDTTSPYTDHSTLRYARLTPEGLKSKLDGSAGHQEVVTQADRIYYWAPQLVTDTGDRVQLVAQRYDGAAGTDKIVHIRQNGSSFAAFTELSTAYNSMPRVAVRPTELCVTWSENGTFPNSKVYYRLGTIVEGTGAVSWAPPKEDLLASDPRSINPDVDFDVTGTPHFVWAGGALGSAKIRHKKLGDTETEVSTGTSVGSLPHSFDAGGRILIVNDDIHILYAGWSHASKNTGSSSWMRAQPMALATQTPKQSRRPQEMSKGAGKRIDVVNGKFYASGTDSVPDGASFVDVFPGASVNTVPINGSLRYRLKLFSTSGVGPCTSLGLTYDSRRIGGSHVGPGWTMDHLMNLTVTDDNIALTLPNGLSFTFVNNGSGVFGLTEPGFGFMAAIQNIGGAWNLCVPGGRRYAFSATGRMDTVTDPTGNFLKVNYDVNGRASTIVDQQGNGGSGRATSFTYGTGANVHRITGVTDPEGNTYTLVYVLNKLTEVWFNDAPLQTRYKFLYNTTTGLLETVVPPRGYATSYGYTVTYDGAARVTKVQDPQEWHLVEPSAADAATSNVRAELNIAYNDVASFTSAGKFHTRVSDRRTKSSVYVFDPAKNFGVKEFWDPAAFAGASGIKEVKRLFDADGNILEEDDRWGFKTKYTYRNPSNAPLGIPLWMRGLVEKVEKPHPTTAGAFEEVESYVYVTSDPLNPLNLGKVLSHTTRASLTNTSTPVLRTTTYGYNLYGQTETVTTPAATQADGSTQTAGVLTNQYLGPRRQLSRSINEEGNGTTYSAFHHKHGLAQSTRRDGDEQSRQIRYDEMGNLTRTLAPQGGPGNDIPGWTIKQLDGLYRVEKVTDPTGRETINTYDADSNLTSVLPPAGGATTTAYDKRGFPTGGTSPDGTWVQAVDPNGNVRRKSSIRNVAYLTFMDYDDLGRVKEVRAPGAGLSTGGGPVMRTVWEHDGFTGPTGPHYKLETEMGDTGAPALPNRVTKSLFDNRGRVIRVEGPDAAQTVSKTFYDEQDQVIATEAHLGAAFQTATLTFRDQRGRVYLTRVQNAPYTVGGTPGQKSDSATFYNKAGFVTQTVGPKGNPAPGTLAYKTTFIPDSRQRVSLVIDGLGNIVKENLWGDDDLLSEVRAPDPEKKSHDLVRAETRTYTARKELKTVRNRANFGPSYAYNAVAGQVDTVTDALGRVMKTTYYSDTQRVDEAIAAYGTPNERRTKSVWTGGLPTETRVWNPQALSYSSSYLRTYDQADRPETFQAPLVATEEYDYNSFGELAVQTAGAKNTTRLYNELGQNTTTTYVIPGSTVPETRTYNGLGQLKSVAASGLTKTFAFTAGEKLWLGLPDAETFNVTSPAWTKTQTHRYDIGKNYESLLDAEGGEHSWLYDANDRLYQGVYKRPSGIATAVYTVAYTPGGLIDYTTCHNESGVAITRSTHYYDTRGRKTRVHTVLTATGKTLSDFEWEYNDADVATKKKLGHLAVEISYGYNERYELTSEAMTSNNSGQALPPNGTVLGGSSAGLQVSAPSGESTVTPATLGLSVVARSASYIFDKAGNRTSQTIDGVTTTFTYNAASQLTNETAPGRTVTHLYDNWGNEYRRTTVQGTSTQEDYQFNHLNLMSVYTHSTTAANNRQYAYWPTGERFEKAPTTGTIERYLPRGGDVAADYNRNGSTTTLKNVYVQGTGIDQKQLRIDAGADFAIGAGDLRRHYVGDQVGTLSMTLSDAGVVQETNLSDAWGVKLSAAVSAERYGFAQRELDTESGLVHMRARQYDPKLGRFTQTDPLLEHRASEHYVYVANDPVSKIDPMGTQDVGEQYWRILVDRVNRLGSFEHLAQRDQELAQERFDPQKLLGLSGYRKHIEDESWKQEMAAYEAQVAARKAKEWDSLPIEKRVGKWVASRGNQEVQEWFQDDPAAKAHFLGVINEGLEYAGAILNLMVDVGLGGGAAIIESGIKTKMTKEAAVAAAKRFKALAWDDAIKGYRWNEAVQAVRFERQFGVTLTRGAGAADDFVAGEVRYSFTGGFKPQYFRSWNYGANIRKKLLDKTTKVVVDVSPYSKKQAAEVETFVRSLSAEDRARVIFLR